MSPRLARLAPILIFLLGLFTGVALSVLWVGHRVRNFVENGPAKATRFGIEKVANRLDLDEAQRAELAPVFTRLERAFTAMHREDLHEVRGLVEGAATEMRPKLRPEQQVALDKMLEAPRRRWEKFLGVAPTAGPGAPSDGE